MPVERHLQYLHERRNNADVGHEAEEAEVDIRQAGPGKRPGAQQVVGYEVVHGHRDCLHGNNGESQTDCCLDTLRDGQERAHAEEKRQRQVFDECGPDEQVDVLLHQITSVRCTS